MSGQFLAVVLMIVALVVLARLLTPREMGIYAVGVASVGILQTVATFGLGHFITREAKLSQSVISTAFTVNTILGVLLAGSAYGLSFAGAALFSESGVAAVLKLLALVPLIGVFEFLPASLMQRDMQFKALSIVLILRSLGSTGVTILSVWLGAAYLSAAYGAIAYAVIGAVGMNIARPGNLVARPGLGDWRRVVPFGLRVMSIGGISVLAIRASELVIGRVAGLAALGIYTRASTLHTAIYTNVFGVAARVVFAKLAQDSREVGDIRHTYLNGLRMLLAVVWPLVLGVGVLAGPIIYHAFGPRWLAAAPVLTILMIAQAVMLLMAMNYELFTLRDELHRQTRYEVIRSTFGLICVSVGCMFSLEAAAMGRVAENALGAVMYVPQMARLSGTRISDILRTFVGNLLIATITIIPIMSTMCAFDWRADAPLWALTGGVVMSGVAWLVTLRVTHHPLFGELRHMVRMSSHFIRVRTAGQ